MQGVFQFVMIPMVYAAFAVFLTGIIVRATRFLRARPKSGTRRIFPVRRPVTLAIAGDTLLLPTVRRRQITLWVFLGIFHVSFLLLILGHLELIGDLPLLTQIPHKIFLGRGMVGIALAVSLLYFMLRRFRSPYREISVPSDYILLGLLFLTVIFGSHLNLAILYSGYGLDIGIEEFRAYLGSLFHFTPMVPETIAYSPHYIIVVIHVLLANLVLMVFPFTSLYHSMLTFFTARIRRI